MIKTIETRDGEVSDPLDPLVLGGSNGGVCQLGVFHQLGDSLP